MSRAGDELELRAAPGFIDEQLRAELPGLRLDWVSVAGTKRSSPPAVIARLRQLSDRYRGASVIAMRTQPVPHAYRAFFRQIGLDPDVDRIPSEEAAVERLLHGQFRSSGALEDALLIALVETGVPVWALDAEQIDSAGLGIRVVAGGALVVGDGARTCCALFEHPSPECAVAPRTRRVTLFTLAVDGVPEIHVEEALWCALDLLAPGF